VRGYPAEVIALVLKPSVVLDDTSAMMLAYSTNIVSTGEDFR
jgi:hypothetical protein